MVVRVIFDAVVGVSGRIKRIKACLFEAAASADCPNTPSPCPR